MKRAAAYVRVSTGDQAQGISLDMQRQHCERYAHMQGWQLDIFADVQSARTADRPNLLRLRRHLGDYAALVCWRLDRVSRSVTDCVDLVEDCQRDHVQLVSVTEGFDSATPIGQAMVAIISAFAQLESDTIGERVRAAKGELARQGKLPWRRLFGYDRAQDGTAVINETEAAAVSHIFRLRDQGDTQQAIADALVAEGHVKRGRPWTREAVNNVLHDSSYIGLPLVRRVVRDGRRYRSLPKSEWTPAPGLLPPIISEELWERTRRRGIRGKRPAAPVLFRGLLRCGRCDAPLHAATSGKSVRYICYRRDRHRQCDAPSVVELKLREALEQWVREPWPCPVDRHDRHDRTEDYLAAHQMLERAKELYVEGLLHRAELRRWQDRFTETQAICQEYQLSRRLTGTPSADVLAACRQALGAADPDWGNRKLRRVLARILVHHGPTVRLEPVLWAGGDAGWTSQRG